MDVRRTLRLVAVAACAAAALPASAWAAAEQPAGGDAPPPPPLNRVIVVFERGTTVAERASVRADAETTAIETLGRSDFQLLKPRLGQSVDEAVEVLRRDPSVRSAEADGYSWVQSVPDDPKFGQLWGLQNLGQNVGGVTGGVFDADIDATRAWDRTVGTPETVVADLDSGYRFQHPDLASVAWTNPGEIAGNGVDDDGNGKVDDTRGWDAVDNDNDPTAAVNGHGVHTAGTIGAKGDDGIGVTGVAQDVRIMPVQVCTASGSCPFSQQVEGINYAGRNGARVANMSLGGTNGSATVLDALAANPQTLFVIAAGNDGALGSDLADNDLTPHYPCNHDPSTADPKFGYTPPPGAVDNVVCVAATTQSDVLASFSDFGPASVDLGAPGTETLSTDIVGKVYEEGFEGSGFDGWAVPADATAGGFVRSNAAPQTSFGITNDSSTQPPSTVRASTTPTFSPSAGTTSCTLSQRRVLTLGGGDAYSYRVLVDGNDVGGATPTLSGTFTLVVTLAASATPHNIQIQFRYSSGAASPTTNGAWIDDVKASCVIPPGTEDGDTYGFKQGTSMAAPHVSGAAALLFSLKPSASVAQVKDALLSSVDPAPALAGATVTGGRLNVFKALNALVPLDTAITSGPPATTTVTGATFAFDTAGSGTASFECRLDGAAFSACTSSATVKGLGTGPHAFEVRSTVDGVVDATPAAAQWTVTEPAAAPTGPTAPTGASGPTQGVSLAISGLSLSSVRFAVDSRGAAERAVAAAAHKGTAFRFMSATPARVLYTVEALKPGRRSGRRCVAPTRARRGTAACTRAVPTGRFAAQAAKGANRKPFSGRIGAKRLVPGSYRATLVAAGAGRRSAPRSVRFTVVAL